jgi:nucleotide-binding universal stress UspA family protein
MSPRVVVVGISPRQRWSVVDVAARMAAALDAELVCARVLTGHYVVEWLPDGNARSLPVDPEAEDWAEGHLEPELLAALQRHLAGQRWSTRTVAGDPADALAHLAQTLSAELIVVGSRNREGVSGWRSFGSGSVATHLAHRQHRPVLVVPVDPVSGESPAPWDKW